MSVTLTISQKELAKLKKGINTYKKTYGSIVRKRIAIAGKEMESVAKLTVNNAGLVDTGRLKSSLVAQPIDKGYGSELKTDDPDKEIKSTRNSKYNKSDKRGTVKVVNYAKYHEGRVKFMERGQKAGYKKFLTMMKHDRNDVNFSSIWKTQALA